MKTIRRCVFETNSSSTHSICLTTTDDTLPSKFPSELRFEIGEFGWEHAILDSAYDKASYLYTSILAIYPALQVNNITAKITDMLWKHEVKATFENPEGINDPDSYGSSYYDIGYGYVDHAGGDDHEDFIKRVTSNDKRLLRYLFDPASYVVTGNDNDGSDVRIYATYPHEEFYKGN